MPPVEGVQLTVALVAPAAVTFGAPGAERAEAVPDFACTVTVVIEYGGRVQVPVFATVAVSIEEAWSRKVSTVAAELSGVKPA